MATLFSDNSDFVYSLGVFVPLKDVQYANSHGITMAANNKPAIMLPAATWSSGFDPKYQESIDKVNVVQAHQSAAFFELGYSARFLAGAAAPIYKDISPYNPGDINLGIAAARLGAERDAGLISRAVLPTISERRCANTSEVRSFNYCLCFGIGICRMFT